MFIYLQDLNPVLYVHIHDLNPVLYVHIHDLNPMLSVQCFNGKDRICPTSYEVPPSSRATSDPRSRFHIYLSRHPVAGEVGHSNQGRDGGLHQGVFRVTV